MNDINQLRQYHSFDFLYKFYKDQWNPMNVFENIFTEILIKILVNIHI